MERKVGEIFEYNGEWYQCVECDSCGKCSLRTTECGSGAKSDIADEVFGECSKVRRTDNKHAIFKKLKKVGEPIRIENKSYQKIKVPDAVCNNCAFYDNFSRDCKLNDYINHYPTHSCLTDEMFVEIKQNKENMGEKKLNLKPFDLEAAKAGKTVCTRDGRKVRIISFDRKFLFKGVSYPIIALVEDTAKEETIYGYNEKGKVIIENDTPYKDDLMMLPQKKEGWVNIYNRNRPRTSSENCYIMTGVSVFETKEGAISYIDKDKEYIDTVKIEWEE